MYPLRLHIFSIFLLNLTLVACYLLITSQPLSARYGGGENWPCVQRKVAKLTVGEMWTISVLDEKNISWKQNQLSKSIIKEILPRRISIEKARDAIRYFVKTNQGQNLNKHLADIFLELLSQTNSIRTSVVGGIGRYAARQKQLARTINTHRKRVTKLEAIDEPSKEQDKELGELDKKLEWDIRIHEEREQSLEYVCEVPVLLSQRLYQLAKELQKHYIK